MHPMTFEEFLMEKGPNLAPLIYEYFENGIKSVPLYAVWCLRFVT